MGRTYEEIQRQTLGLINQSTMVGVPIASSYNNQADYELRIPALINSAVRSIGCIAKRRVVLQELTEARDFQGMKRYPLPEDFYQLRSGGVLTSHRGQMTGVTGFRLLGQDTLLVPAEVSPVFVEYYAYYPELPEKPLASDVLEVDPEVLDAAQVYAAAQLVSGENEYLYASLYNDYESRLGRISQGMVAQSLPVQDQYAFSAGGDLY